MAGKKWFGLENRICVVLGSEGLIGSGCAEALLDCGAGLVLVDKLPISKISSSASTYISMDLTNDDEFSKLNSVILDRLKAKPKAEVFFINASYPRTENWSKLNFLNVTKEELLKNFEIHLGSAFLFSQYSVGFLRTNGRSGGIVNFGSIYGTLGPDLNIYSGTNMNNPSPYSAIKAGIEGFTRYISTVYGSEGIRANLISPGGVENGQPSSFVQAYEKRTPMKRMAKVDDVAGVCAFLVSPAAGYINGQTLFVDGGWSAW